MTAVVNQDFDLSSSGTVVELRLTQSDQNYGFQFESTAAVDVVIEIAANDSPFFEVRSFSGVDRIDDGFQAPEADTVRLRTISTAAGTADALLGGGGQ
jgi:hypothetical protein